MTVGGCLEHRSIVSLTNPLVRRVVRLRRAGHRADENRLLVEGLREVSLALAAGLRVETLFYPREALRVEAAATLVNEADQRGVACIVCSAGVFEKMAIRGSTALLLALAVPPRRRPLTALPLSENPLLLVVDAVEKPGNLGAMLRSADAASADALLLCDGRTSPFNPNVVRASLGALFTVPVVECEASEAREVLARKGIALVAAAPEAPVRYTDCDLTCGTALIVGAEDRGLNPYWQENADLRVRIPMLGSVDSLNVSNAAALLLYEAVRQRIAAGLLYDTPTRPHRGC